MILEKKSKKKYTVKYLTPLFFGLHYWKKLDNTQYKKYEDALNAVKKVIKQNDYETTELGFHYVDAYKIFKAKEQPERETSTTKNKAVFIQKK